MTLVTKNIAQFKETVLSKKIVKKQVSLSEIKLLSDEIVELNGVILSLDKTAFKSLLKMVGISNQMRNNQSLKNCLLYHILHKGLIWTRKKITPSFAEKLSVF